AEISITNNRIGVSRSVASAISNGGHGIRVENGRSNTIGSGNAGNVVSGNLRAGISLEGLTSQTTIEGNIIGTDSSGLTDLGNGSDGIAVLGTSSENIIGKPEANSGNLIAFNAGAGIRIDSEQTASAVSTFDTSTERWTATDDVLKRGGDIRVFHGEDFGNPGGGLYTRNPSNSNTNFWRAPSKFLGNRSASYGGTITYDVQQTLVDANNLEPHIILVSGDRRLYYVTRELPRPNLWHTYEIPITASAGWTDAFPQQGNRPSEDEMREVLAHLTDLYVRAEYAHVSRADEGFMDNFAMTGVGDLVEADNTRNSIRGNSIHSNGGLGIDLGRDGPEDNDAFDSDVGPNNLLNGPILTSAVTIGKSTSVAGRLVGAASTAYTIDIYINDMCDPTGFGEGSVFVGTDVVFIDDDGQSEFNITANSAIAPGMQVVASLTDAHGNTSEFSNCVAATGRLAGDIDGNSILDVMDLDAITAAVLAGIQQSQYDVNSDGVVDNKDREHWIEDLFGTSFGDANLDGVFDSADFVLIFTAGEYEDNIDSVPSTGRNSTWAEGDWDGDGEFTTSDFVVALQTGKYVAASRSRLGDIVFATSGGNGDG
ncbi:MAG: hypothetical protein KDB27_27425, partial [Planctomycetales bacterium]|nr:hypothetical protein [Planctomycetales bacterium]